MSDNIDKKSEEYIINESTEISVGENMTWVKRILSAFPAFSNKNYRLYFLGQLISLIGTWLQNVAQGWLVWELTKSVFYLGLIAAIGSLPSLLLTLFGGVIVDRFPKRKILLSTQICAMGLAFVLGILTVLNIIKVWEIGLLAFLLGMVNAVDAPARQAFVSELVNKEQLPSAIALNSSVFNAARVIGPGVAGLLIALVGTGGAFIMNGLSYVAVIIALLSMTVKDYVPETRLHPIKAIKAGLFYSFSHPIISTLIIMAGVVSVFGWSFTTVLPKIAQDEFHLGAAGLGYLSAASGLGSFLAAFIIAAFSSRISSPVFIFGGNFIFAVGAIIFSFTTSIYFALPALFLAGFGLLSMAAMINTTVQRLVKQEYRGRVMSIYILMFIGLSPLGSLQIGILSDRFGTSFAIRLGAIIVLIFGLIIFFYRNKIRSAYFDYKKVNPK